MLVLIHVKSVCKQLDLQGCKILARNRFESHQYKNGTLSHRGNSISLEYTRRVGGGDRIEPPGDSQIKGQRPRRRVNRNSQREKRKLGVTREGTVSSEECCQQSMQSSSENACVFRTKR